MGSPGSPRSRFRLAYWGAAGVVAAMAVAAGAIYLERGPIAERLARAWLARQGVASSLRLRSISLTGLSATLRLGDPAHPDLSIQRLDVGYALSGPWNGKPFGVETRTLRLVRPRLVLRLVNGRLDLGALGPLVRDLSRQPPGAGPPPDVAIEDGVAILETPGGRLRAQGDGALRGGALAALDARVDPFAVTLAGARLRGAGGALRLARRGGHLALSANLGATQAAQGASRLGAAEVTLSGQLPSPTPQGRWIGPVRLALAASGVSASAGPAVAAGGRLEVELDGTLAAHGASQSLRGRLRTLGQIGSLAEAGARAQGVTARIDLPDVTLAGDAAGVTAFAAAGDASLTVGGLRDGAAMLSNLVAGAQAQGLDVSLGHGRLSGTGMLQAHLVGRLALAAGEARRLAAAVPLPPGLGSYAAALERGLRDLSFAAPAVRLTLAGRGMRLGLGAPVSLAADSGARLAIAPAPGGLTLGPDGGRGGAELTLGGGGLPALRAQIANATASPAGYRADIAAAASFDAAVARGARLRLRGRLSGAGGSARFVLAGCADESAASLGSGATLARKIGVSLCPADGPLVAVAASGWTAQGRLAGGRGELTSYGVGLRGLEASFRLAGGGAGLRGATLELGRGRLVDAAAPVSFEPVDASGRLGFGAGVWRGRLVATTARGRKLGRITLRADPGRGVGRADVDAGALAFAPGALQPADLSPLLAFARSAEGAAPFRGWFAWGPGGRLSSGGELIARSINFTSPLGPVQGLSADLHFTSLAPLLTAPGQSIDVALVKAITPMSGLSARFRLGATALSIEAASGEVAHGRISLEPTVAPLAPGSTIDGALVLDRVDLGDVIAASSLASAVKLDAVVDGRIPFRFGPGGLTIQQGRLRAVRPGVLSISRAALTGGAASTAAGQTAFGQDLAYQALDNLAFQTLDASLNTLPGDRLGVLFHIEGQHDPGGGKRAVVGLADLIGGKAFAKPMTLPSGTGIDLTLDTSLNFGQLVGDLGQAWRESLGGAAARSAPVQAPGKVVSAR